MIPRVFIGYDSRETASYHVLAHSIQARASKPVAIIPVDLRNLRAVYTRLYGQQSTEFTYSRFLVPYLSGFEGISVFMDCDMLCIVEDHQARPVLPRVGDLPGTHPGVRESRAPRDAAPL